MMREARSPALLVGEDMEAEAHVHIDKDAVHPHLHRERIQMAQVISEITRNESTVGQRLLP